MQSPKYTPPCARRTILARSPASSAFRAAAQAVALCLLLLAVCPPGYFGERCEEQCDCVHSVSCHHQTGACRCKKGWRGRHCDKRECLRGVQGAKLGVVLYSSPIPVGGWILSLWVSSEVFTGMGAACWSEGVALCCPAWVLTVSPLQLACLATTARAVPSGAGALPAPPATT